jgi:glutaredoxin 3
MITIYATRFCSSCDAARRLLASKGCRWEEVDVGADAERRREMTARSGRRTVPQIWIGDRHVGGYDELARLEAAGELDPLLRAESESKT